MQPINMNVNPGSDGPLVLHGLFVGPGGVGGHGLGVGLLAGVGGVSCAVSVIVPILRALVKTNAKKRKNLAKQQKTKQKSYYKGLKPDGCGNNCHFHVDTGLTVVRRVVSE